ncbi:MAG: UDP-N-acetylmuramoyl-tripeptide--D-alanyl-D-alanine ligase [Pirellulales bacterium]|nr:UDP-N-acetylmuramoyl-tripeptide--D-alanyl-D-alanine ligase [Pirellulales bacterium]
MLTLSQLCQITGGQLRMAVMPPRHGETSQVGPIVTDSRRVQADMVFWGLPGAKFDGACFAEDALMRGASGVVVSGRSVEPWAGRWALRVEDSLRSLWTLATWHRREFAGRMIAVTGSVGKTTTRLMIDAVLGSKYSGITSPKNYNNHVGLPLSLLRLERDHAYAAVELGANGPNEIDKLAQLCRPHIGVVTRIAEAHLGGFGSQQALAEAKTDLIAALPQDGLAVLNGDDAWLRRLAHRTAAKITWVGREGDCQVVAHDIRARGGVLQFCVEHQRFRVPVWGRHHLTGALAAIAIGLEFGMSHGEIAAALMDFDPPSMRCQVSDVGGTKVIDDSYNSSPTAMRAALRLLREVDAPGERVIVCGDMAELGEASSEFHRKLGEEIVTHCGPDRLIVCGRHSEVVVRAARKSGMPAAKTAACRLAEDTIPLVRPIIQRGNAVLVKGSRAMEMERVVEAIRRAA